MSNVRRGLKAIGARSELFGVLDYGLASLATFLIGLFAARSLTPAELGIYALCFRAVFLGGVVPSHGVFLPSENLLVTLPSMHRLAAMRQTLRIGTPAALLSALLVSLWVIMAPAGTSPQALLALTLTGVAAAFFSPVQDHVRRMLHLSGVSRVAALVSLVQVAVVVVSLLVARAAGIAIWWAPFGALALANLVSLVVGVAVGRRAVTAEAPPAILRREEIRRSGRWLVSLALLDAASVFAVAAVVAHIAGPSALGYAEAARIAAHPVMVLAWGLSAVLGPGSVRAARERQLEAARRIRRTFAGILGLAGALSLLVLTTNWWGNPMAWLLPTAYVVPGLAGLSILAYLANGLGYPFWSELLGGRRERRIAGAELQGALVRLIFAGTAAVTRAYAVPLSLLGFGLTRWLAFYRTRNVGYAAVPRSELSP